jgi:hypothetical protein
MTSYKHSFTLLYVDDDRRSVRRFLVKANAPSSPILVTVMMEALCFSENSVFITATRRNMPEDGIVQSPL